MKIKNGFTAHSIGSEHIVVPVGELASEISAVIRLNSSGKLLWDNMQEDFSIDSLTAVLLEHYEVDEATAKSTVEAFLQTLKDGNILE